MIAARRIAFHHGTRAVVVRYLSTEAPAQAAPAAAATDDKPLTQRQRLKQLFATYGKVAVGTHIALSMCSITGMYFAVKWGVDVNSILASVGLPVSQSSSAVGTFAVAYVAHKATLVIRVPLTIALTPIIARKLRLKQTNTTTSSTTTATSTPAKPSKAAPASA